MRARILLIWILLVSALAGAERPAVWMGMSPAQLVAELGDPASSATAEGRQILIYADGARFEFVGGQLSEVDGYGGQTRLGPPEALPAPHSPEAPGQPPPVIAPPAKPKPEPPAATAPLARLEHRGVPTYAAYAEKSLPALETAARFFRLAYDPRLVGRDGHFGASPLLMLACLFRMALTAFAVWFTVRRMGRRLSALDYFLMASVDFLARVAVATAGVFLLGREVPILILELLSGAALAGFAMTRPEVARPVLALRLVLMAKVIAFIVSFLGFFTLVDFVR